MNPLVAYSTSPLELMLPSGRTVLIPACFHRFKPWQGAPIEDSYGHKPVLDYNGEPLFAELTILRLIQPSGWHGVWIDTYRKKFRQSWPHFCDLPPEAHDFLDKANQGREWCRGCWDVLAWSAGEYLFVEMKRRSKDRIRRAQKEWLESALTAGLRLENFAVCEWEIES